MKAKLVYLSLMTRVVVEDDADDEIVMDVARQKFADKIQYEYLENVEDIQDDLEVPYDEETDIEDK